jgi:ABC-2 type transport system ATP-binding protein
VGELTNPAIQIRGLVKIFQVKQEVRAIDGINLDVLDGEIFGLLGPNGAGKTTTIGACTTRIRPTRGQITINGVDVQADPARARQFIGVVPQQNTLDRSCNAFENIYYHCRYFGMHAADARQRAKQLLEEFKLTERAEAMPWALSGGMAQRLQIARAIAHRPRVLFLDEPTAGLDPQSRLAVWELVRGLHRQGITVLMTTHYMDEADQLCDRISIIDHGKILVNGKPAELKQQVGGQIMMEIHAANAPAQVAERLGQIAGVTSVEPVANGFRLWVAGRDGLLPKIVEAMHGYDLRDISVKEPTLETVFIRLTGRELRD